MAKEWRMDQAFMINEFIRLGTLHLPINHQSLHHVKKLIIKINPFHPKNIENLIIIIIIILTFPKCLVSKRAMS